LREALADPQFVRAYSFDATVECGWKKGSPWKLVHGAATNGQYVVCVQGRRSFRSGLGRQRQKMREADQ